MRKFHLTTLTRSLTDKVLNTVTVSKEYFFQNNDFFVPITN